MWVARVGRQRQTSNKLRIMLAEAIRQIKENQVIDTRACILHSTDMPSLVHLRTRHAGSHRRVS